MIALVDISDSLHAKTKEITEFVLLEFAIFSSRLLFGAFPFILSSGALISWTVTDADAFNDPITSKVASITKIIVIIFRINYLIWKQAVKFESSLTLFVDAIKAASFDARGFSFLEMC